MNDPSIAAPAPAHRSTVEAIASRILRSGPTVSDLSIAFGGPAVASGAEVAFRWRASPFAGVGISAFRSEVDLMFDLEEGHWQFRDLVAEAAAWTAHARLPDTGVLEAVRSWTSPTKSVTCVVRLEGEGPLETLTVTGQARCQVSS